MKNFSKIVILITLIVALSAETTTTQKGGAEASTSKSFSHIIYRSVKAGGAS